MEHELYQAVQYEHEQKWDVAQIFPWNSFRILVTLCVGCSMPIAQIIVALIIYSRSRTRFRGLAPQWKTRYLEWEFDLALAKQSGCLISWSDTWSNRITHDDRRFITAHCLKGNPL